MRKLALAAISLVVLDQALQWSVLRDGEFLGVRIAPFGRPLFSRTQEHLLEKFEEQLADPTGFERHSVFDSDLGWCPRAGMRRGGRTYDWAGARIGLAPLPRERASDERLVALVGCSFTEGHEVADHQSWAALLEADPHGLRIANLGVGGYGVDQALLRARRDALRLEPAEVWLGFFPGGALRVTTQFPPIQSKWRARGVLFKPRFLLGEDGSLELVPSPAREPTDVPRLLRDPAALFGALRCGDAWVRRAPAAYAPRGSHWVHYSAFARLLTTWYEHGGRQVVPRLRDTGDEVYRLQRALILGLRDEVAGSGARFRVVVLPSAPDLAQHARDGRGYWGALLEELNAAGIEVLDPSARLQAAGGADEPSLWMPGGHYSPAANALVAEEIAQNWL